MFDFHQFFSAMANPARQEILSLLKKKKELSVNELVDKLNLSQSTVSYHISVLKDARVIEPREQGAQTFYRICPKECAACCLKIRRFFKK